MRALNVLKRHTGLMIVHLLYDARCANQQFTLYYTNSNSSRPTSLSFRGFVPANRMNRSTPQNGKLLLEFS